MARRITSMDARGEIGGPSYPPEGGHGWVRDEFVTLASHELMTPLTSLKLQVQAMKHKTDREPAESPVWVAPMLAVLDRQVGRLAHLVEDLILTTRIQAGELTPCCEAADLGAVVRAVVADVVVQSRGAISSIEIDIEGRLCGSFDRDLIAHVVFHLLKNAVTFGEHRPIAVSARAAPGRAARITVRDHGVGIAAEDLERIFECFERAVPVEHYGGLGLGLYLAREIVRAHGGAIAVESAPGEGTTFTIELPITADRSEASVEEERDEVPLAA